MEAFGKGQGSLAQVEGSNPALLRLGAGIGVTTGRALPPRP
jgi:hypothetical protein